MALRIIITAPAHPFLMETLTQHGYEVMYEPAISYDALSKIIDTAHAKNIIGLVKSNEIIIKIIINSVEA